MITLMTKLYIAKLVSRPVNIMGILIATLLGVCTSAGIGYLIWRSGYFIPDIIPGQIQQPPTGPDSIFLPTRGYAVKTHNYFEDARERLLEVINDMTKLRRAIPTNLKKTFTALIQTLASIDSRYVSALEDIEDGLKQIISHETQTGKSHVLPVTLVPITVTPPVISSLAPLIITSAVAGFTGGLVVTLILKGLLAA